MGTKPPSTPPFGTQNFSLYIDSQPKKRGKEVKFGPKWVPNKTKTAFWYPTGAILDSF